MKTPVLSANTAFGMLQALTLCVLRCSALMEYEAFFVSGPLTVPLNW
jgi:hypothetical protein